MSEKETRDVGGYNLRIKKEEGSRYKSGYELREKKNQKNLVDTIRLSFYFMDFLYGSNAFLLLILYNSY